MKRMIRWIAPVLALGLLVPVISKVVRAADAPAADAKGKVIGTVKGDDGKPAAGVNVSLLPPGSSDHHKGGGDADKPKAQAAGDKPKGNHPEPIAKTKTDGDGKYTLNDVPPGTYELHAGLKGAGMAHEEVKVDAGQTVTCDLTLKKMEHKPQQ
jgi:hypothetical protein